jgi:hypothetical protein
VSPRHAKPSTALRRVCLTGAVGAATVGATIATMALAGPAQSSATLAQAAATPPVTQPAPGSPPAHSTLADHAVRIPVPRTGTDANAQVAPANAPVKNVPVNAPGQAPAKKARSLPTADDVLKLAISQVGTTENAAGGSKFNQWFMTTPYAQQGAARYGGRVSDYANASWCDMFVSWLGDQLGVKGMGDNAFTPAHARWFQQQGRWGNVPEPGAVVFFSWNGDKSIDGIDHVGLVIKDDHDGTIQTVEGNTDNAVKIRTRSTDQVVGYGYPQYAQ